VCTSGEEQYLIRDSLGQREAGLTGNCHANLSRTKLMSATWKTSAALSIALILTLSVGSPKASSPGGWKELEDKGITLGAGLTVDFVANTRGGLRQGSGRLGNLDLTVSIDTERAGLWPGGCLTVCLLGDYGDDPTSLVGDIQTTSNIEAFDTFKLYQAWYEQRWLGDKCSILLGLHDYNSEFDALEYACAFMNSSFGISPDISQVGPSIFPTAALAGRFRFQPTERLYLIAAAYDGVPGDPDDPRGTKIILKKSDGIFYGTEFGVVASEDAPGYHKLGIGGWYLDSTFEDFSGTQRSTNRGIYAIGEASVFREPDRSQGLGVFIQTGCARGDRNQIGSYFGVGLAYTGLLPGRHHDVSGLAVAHARNGDAFAAAHPDLDRAETAVEWTHRAELLPWFSVQADVQYILNPGMDPTLDPAVYLAVRAGITF